MCGCEHDRFSSGRPSDAFSTLLSGKLAKTISPIENGGLLNNSGVVEVVSCIDESGIDVPNSLRWGILIVLTTDNSYLTVLLERLRNGNG